MIVLFKVCATCLCLYVLTFTTPVENNFIKLNRGLLYWGSVLPVFVFVSREFLKQIFETHTYERK